MEYAMGGSSSTGVDMYGVEKPPFVGPSHQASMSTTLSGCRQRLAQKRMSTKEHVENLGRSSEHAHQ